MPAADRNKPKPGHKHLNTLNVPDADLAAISHAAIDAGQTRMEYIRALIHADAERVRAKQKLPNGRPAYKFELTVTGIDTLAADDLLLNATEFVDKMGGEIGGGYHRVDDNGNPTA